jgi:hypothetical protein
MARRPSTPAIADRVLEPQDATVLDVLDFLLNRGVMLNADVTMGVAGIDLIYLRLSSLLCAADRILPPAPGERKRRPRHRQPGARR